jgi:CHAD domain-containing protein
MHAADDQLSSGVEQALAQVRLVKTAMPAWRLPKRDIDFYVAGMSRVYAKARQLLQDGLQSGDSVVLHEARKSVIHLRYHLETIEPVWPGLFKAWAKELQTLREVLGDINDLHDMEMLIANEQSAFSAMPGKEAALTLIGERRQALIAQARPLVQRLYAEKPSGFSTRISALWNSWVKHEH